VIAPVPSFLLNPAIKVTETLEFVYVPLFEDRSFLYQKYVVEGLNPAQIAAQTFSCRTTIMARLRAFDIPLRHEAEGYKTRSQLGFGQTMRQNRVIANQRELAAIRKMQKLRERGWSYWKIADVMNDWGIRTKTGKGKWHARSVQQILGKAGLDKNNPPMALSTIGYA
jgi:hypothetical protein